MTILSFFTSLYGMMYNRRGLHPRVLSPFRYVIRKLANLILPVYLSKSVLKKRGERIDNLIISFTSFPARIEKVWMVVECLKRQSCLPKKIILWLSKEQFASENSIPESLRNLVDELFEIRMVDDDIRSHKKYYYAFNEYPSMNVVTVDDDVFYHPNVIMDLVNNSRLNPECIIANTTTQMVFKEGKIEPYSKWNKNVLPHDRDNLVQIGIGGVLYPPHLLPIMTQDKNVFMAIAPMADDLWLNAMAQINGIPVIQSVNKYLPLPILNTTPSLSQTNVGHGGNDDQLEKIRHFLIKNNHKDILLR